MIDYALSASAQAPKFRPRSFGNYTLLAPIATGGMGEVFLARRRSDSGVERVVVIKRILPHLSDKPEFIQMFLDEARVAAQIHHPNVCQILELGQVEERYYMALEYLEGISLTQLIVRGREHPELRELRLLVSLMTQVCEGLHFAHNVRKPDGSLAGVVHRDVNPKNIFVTSAGMAKVIDFGIVKAMGALNVTRTGSVKGTYSYMSPEQIQATSVDRRSDIFSLGIVSWETFTGCRLFKRDNDFHTWRAITEEPIPPPSRYREDLPPELDEVVLTALARDREQRFRTARDLAVALEGALGLSPMTPLAVASRVEKAFADEIVEQRARTKLTLERAKHLEGNQPAELAWHDVELGDAREIDTEVTPSGERLPTAPEATPSVARPALAPLRPQAPLAEAPSVPELHEPPRRGKGLIAAVAAIVVAGGLAAAYIAYPSGEDDSSAAASAGEERAEEPTEPAALETPAVAPADAGAVAAEEPADAAALVAAPADAAVPEVPVDAAIVAASEPETEADAAPRERRVERRRRRSGERRGDKGDKADQEAKGDDEREQPRGTGFLTVSARPYGTVYVDGRKIGVTPIVKHELGAGRHSVRVVSSVDGDAKTFRVNIRDGKAVRRSVQW